MCFTIASSTYSDDLATERRDSENKKAIEFVKEIQEKWSLGKCNEVVIILFSQRNIQVHNTITFVSGTLQGTVSK